MASPEQLDSAVRSNPAGQGTQSMPDLSRKVLRIRGPRLQAIRARHFRHQPLCVVCDTKGVVRLATELDHVVPLHKGGLDEDSNRQGLCADCHEDKTRVDLNQKMKLTYGPDGFPLP